MDSANGNYRLQSASPCIDAGDPASPFDSDGTYADMGAYYFHQENPTCTAVFNSDVSQGNLPLTVNFTDLSIPGAVVIDEWYWDFGDGNNSALQNPSNEYLLPGIYTVSLTVTDTNDSTDTKIKVDYITVNSPNVWHISIMGSDSTGDGSIGLPFATIQHGISTSASKDTVLVQPGTYVENIRYYGKLITLGSLFLTTQDEAYISSTIIDGNASGSVVRFDNGESSSAILCGFTLTNGLASGGSPWYCGGGICCYDGSSPSLENLVITNNSASYGGGIFSSRSSPSPSMKNVIITGNTASTGGGIYCWDANPSLINSILWSDSPQDIHIGSGSLTVTYSDIQGGYTGTGNIDSDPLFVDAANGDYYLQPASPCIDAGDPTSPLDPDGTIADMGAYYYHQIIAPENLTINILATDVSLSWDAVNGAISYIIYSSDDPYAGFVIDTSGSFTEESWSTSIGNMKKFYYIIASTEASKSEDIGLETTEEKRKR